MGAEHGPSESIVATPAGLVDSAQEGKRPAPRMFNMTPGFGITRALPWPFGVPVMEG
jgi:hypothetical protein